MAAIFIEPTPDRKLLDHNFQGYKLSLRSTTIITNQLSTPVLRLTPPPRQYSLLHAQIFHTHNFLVGEKTNTIENVYFVDRNKNLRKARLDIIQNRLEICKLWKFPEHEAVQTNSGTIYNPCLKLISENLAIASDGIRTFFLLETGDRSIDNKWNILHSEELLQGKSFYIQDAVLKDLELHVLLCSAEQGSRTKYLAVHWITLINESNIWRQKSLKELSVEGNCRYIYLERSCEAIYVASTFSCKFVFDSENIIMDTSDVDKDFVYKQNFKWSQDSKYVAIHFIMPNEIKKEDVKVNCTSSYITVEYKNLSLLDGALYAVVHTELTTISITKNLLEITLAKTDEGDEWSSLLRDFETRRQYVGGINENLDNSASEESDNAEPTLISTAAVEDCDFRNSEHTILERMCANTHKITHRCSLGLGPVLLTMEGDNRKMPSFGVRYDVDLCIWEPHFESNNLELKHITTLLALGYIQATTVHRKFICCPSNFEYTVICDMSRHIFMYRQNRNSESGELINRRTGSRPKKAEQRVLTVPSEEILGIFAVPLGVYVLGETYLMYIEA